MRRIRLVHWKAAEATRYVDLLTSAGFQVEYSETFQPAFLRTWREAPPSAFIFDLSRLPSHCREIAIALRQSKATRSVPLIFCEGDPQKVDKTRALLPDAAFCEFAKLNSVLKSVLKSGPQKEAVVPLAMMDRYSTRTTAQKLGIKEASRVLVLNPPAIFTKL